MALEIEQSALVLYRQKYRETSSLITFLTPEHGKIKAVVKGVHGKTKQSQAKLAWLQPFQTLQISWREKSVNNSPSLVNLRQLEPTSVRFPLIGDANICGLYINELLYKLLPNHVNMEQLFLSYQQTLYDLACSDQRKQQAWVLRQFEMMLLSSLGYALQLKHDNLGNAIEKNQSYLFYPEIGAIKFDKMQQSNQAVLITGDCLCRLQKINNFQNCEQCIGQHRQILRTVLNHHLDGKEIMTRELFQKL